MATAEISSLVAVDMHVISQQDPKDDKTKCETFFLDASIQAGGDALSSAPGLEFRRYVFVRIQ